MARGILALASAVAVARSSHIDDVQCPAQCTSDSDCSLNGVCNQGACQCYPSWTGPCCTALNFLPAQLLRHGYHHGNTSTWGGNIIPDRNGNYHMWIAEMAPNGTDGSGSCGLTTWGANSQITHVMSDNLLGPYARQEVAVGIWSHNPLVRVQPDGTYVLYHIGSGGNNAPGQGYCAANGTSPCGEQGFDKCSNNTGCGTAGSVPGYACYDGYCSGDGGLEGDCGSDLAEPMLDCNSWNSWADCVKKAAAICNTTASCVSFGLSPDWNQNGQAKLFSAGKSGLTPNDQWTMFIQTGHGHDNDIFARVRAHGEGEWPPASAVEEAEAAGLPKGSCTLQMHTATSANGPWTPYTNATISPCGGNNPAPWVHPNGTVYLVVTDNNMGLYSAPSWQGPYTLVTSGACGGGEDPSLYIDSNGYFHCLFHRSPFSNPDIAIGHAWSPDGFTWSVAALPAANSTITFDSGLGPVIHGKRERPHPYFDSKGNIAAFVSGVCINPACNPLEGGHIDPTVDCSSAAQYYRCDANSPDGWTDRTYTLVQPVATA